MGVYPERRKFTKISFEHLGDYWSSGASKEPTAAMFGWFADALAKAKALRNENNYEALLVHKC